MNGNRVQKLGEAIKVSYFSCTDAKDEQRKADSNDNSASDGYIDGQKTENNNYKSANTNIKLHDNNKNSNDNNSHSSKKALMVEKSKESATHFEKPLAKKTVSNSKKKSFARIPVQSHEFRNVRPDLSVKLKFSFCILHV